MQLFILSILLLAILLGIGRLFFLRPYRNQKLNYCLSKRPLVSVHLAICNEPPEVVIQTIKSVLNSDYHNFELVVISNNTPNRKLWQPVAEYTKNKEKVRFFNIEQLAGYKAGALNEALEVMHPKAKYIFTIDADYTLEKHALRTAVAEIEGRQLDFLQFPQAYRYMGKKTEGLSVNYRQYFDCYQHSALCKHSALPTGTLSILKTALFKNEERRWPTSSITEDAELGVELLSTKHTIGYSHKIIGEGIIPCTVGDYFKQYRRWVFGNFQSLNKLWCTKGIRFLQKLQLSAMLSAWINFSGFYFLAIIAGLLGVFLGASEYFSLVKLGLVGVCSHLCLHTILLGYAAKGNFLATCKALSIHYSSWEIASFHWLTYFYSKDRPFLRTNKFLNLGCRFNYLTLLPAVLLFFLTLVTMLQGSHSLIYYSLFGIAFYLIWSKIYLYHVLRYYTITLNTKTT